MRATIGGMTLLLLLMGCDDSGKAVKQTVERNRGAMELQLKQMDEFAAKVERKEASAAKFELPPGVKLTFVDSYHAGNCLLVRLDTFKRGSSSPLVYGKNGIEIDDARRMLEGTNTVPADIVDENIRKFVGVRYIGILQELNSVRPAPNKDGETFSPGKVEFRVDFYDLGEKRELGGLRCTAETSESVMTRKSTTYSALEADLKSNAGKAMDEALKPYQ